jgi:hypothetical protein
MGCELLFVMKFFIIDILHSFIYVICHKLSSCLLFVVVFFFFHIIINAVYVYLDCATSFGAL